MSAPRPVIADLFAAFEKCLATPGEDVTQLYADAFMFAGPDGAQALTREAFAQALPRRDGYFKSLGLVASRITSLDETILDDRYALVRTTWQMEFRRDDNVGQVPLAASYLVDVAPDGPRILVQVDHQDFVERAQRR